MSTPVTDLETESGSGVNGLEYAVSAMQGWRSGEENPERPSIQTVQFSNLITLRRKGWILSLGAFLLWSGMEDSHVSDTSFDLNKNLSLFAVFDGHVSSNSVGES